MASDKSSAARTSTKTASPQSSKPRRAPVGYAQVLGAIPDDHSRFLLLEHFRANGGNRDRWQHSDWSAMCHATSRIEDVWEIDHPRRDRAPLTRLRRLLESRL